MSAKFWINAALVFLVVGTVFPLLNGDGHQAAKGLIGGLSVLTLVLTISFFAWVTKKAYRSLK